MSRVHLGPGTAVALVGLLAMTGVGCQTPPAGNVTLADPPSERAPLAARLTLSTDEPSVITLTIDDGDRRWSVTPSAEPGVDHSVLVLGLRPDATHEVVAIATDAAGNQTASAPVAIVTDPLPDDFPPIELTVSDPERSEPGVTAMAVRRWSGGEEGDTFLILVDGSGRVVWYRRITESVADILRLRNGNFMYMGTVNGVRGAISEIDLLGNRVARWHARALAGEGLENSTLVDTDTFHHDVVELPSGNLAALSSERRTYEDYPTSDTDPNAPTATRDVAGDTIVEFQRDGTIVRQWNMLDLFDPYRISYGSLSGNYWRTTYSRIMDDPDLADWAHANALMYDEQEDAFFVSLRRQDAVVKIDAEMSDVSWILGPHDGWKAPWDGRLLAPQGELEWAYHGHGAKMTRSRTILQFDNGNHRTTAFGKPMSVQDSYSRAVEFAVDEATMTVRQVWAYGPDNERFFSSFQGDADLMPTTGNVLITDGARFRDIERNGSIDPRAHNWVRIVEVTHTTPAEKVFELVIDDDDSSWTAYGAERLPSLYP
jgi:arylsulfate sulfotransferase